MEFKLMSLPFEADALQPFIGARTVQIHYEKHHAGYMKKLDAELTDERRNWSLEKIVKNSNGSVFNFAAQVWNHDFYWRSLSPDETDGPTGQLAQLLARDLDGVEPFKRAFSEAAASEFGSGWAWLVYNDATSRLEVFSTTDAVNPLTSGRIPLLTLDVWEHAYYLDYQNERARYIDAFLDGHINWSFASKNLDAALR